MHMIIKKYFVANKIVIIWRNLKSDYLALEIQFRSISNSIVYDQNRFNYQIKIIKYLDGSYVKNLINTDISYQKNLTGY